MESSVPGSSVHAVEFLVEAEHPGLADADLVCPGLSCTTPMFNDQAHLRLYERFTVYCSLIKLDATLRL